MDCVVQFRHLDVQRLGKFGFLVVNYKNVRIINLCRIGVDVESLDCFNFSLVELEHLCHRVYDGHSLVCELLVGTHQFVQADQNHNLLLSVELLVDFFADS